MSVSVAIIELDFDIGFVKAGLDFRSHAPACAQARWPARISSGVGALGTGPATPPGHGQRVVQRGMNLIEGGVAGHRPGQADTWPGPGAASGHPRNGTVPTTPAPARA